MTFYLADHMVSVLGESIEASFNAERGPVYDGLLALMAFAAYDLGRQVVEENSMGDDQLVTELTAAYKEQLARAHAKKFNFPNALAAAKTGFDGPEAVVKDLQTRLPALHGETGNLAPRPKPGFFKRMLGESPGSQRALIEMAQNGLFFASMVFDSDSDHAALERPIEIMMDDLPD